MMWVRTQDKETLIDCKYFALKQPTSTPMSITLYEIYGGMTPNDIDFLATYATKQRTLEVLDEIEKAIIGKIFIPTFAIEHNYENTAFQMPKE